MLRHVDYQLPMFVECMETPRHYLALDMEAISGSELLDNLILLRFASCEDIASVLKFECEQEFVWLDSDPTPKQFQTIADKYGVLMSLDSSQSMTVYIPAGSDLDEAEFQIDIPNYRFRYCIIADCNYRVVKNNLSLDTLSFSLAPFRPLLVFRRLILDCDGNGGTDMHFQSTYVNKEPRHRIRYRVKRELVDSSFSADLEMLQRVAQTVVSKLSPSSASDLDAECGLTTDIPDLFGDGSCDIRFTAEPVDAGLYIDMAIQDTRTTAMTVDQLGLPKKDVNIIRQLAQRRTGLTLVTGMMRSGKNTTIAAMVNEIKDLPIRIREYSNPVEIRMDIIQHNYKGDIGLLKGLLKIAKKQDLDIAILNEIPDAEVAFAVRDLVNSAIGVITTTHINRVWHVPYKLNEFFGRDYKTVISQLNAVLNHKMFRRWSGPGLVEHELIPGDDIFLQEAYRFGVRKYFTPTDPTKIRYGLQPLIETLVLSEELKTELLNFDEIWRAEQTIFKLAEETKERVEYKLARYINAGICPLDEFRRIY